MKILPEQWLADPERRSRLDREARLLAALNHPHIAAIYGVEEAEGVRALVLELVEGETLAERLHRSRALPLAEALAIARQIADALDAAHERGIVHRDLKPANIKITPDGVVKVLDFGLAKAGGAGGAGADLSNSPTMTIGGTQEGIILGTAAYMSPEQARGKPVDKRADIWAFGCVLYEMLTGRPPFGGETISDIIAAILGSEPDWQALPPTTAPSARRLLARLLDKDVKRRIRDIGDVRFELDEILAGRAVIESTIQPSTVRRWRLAAIASLTALAAALAMLAGVLPRREAPGTTPAIGQPIVSQLTNYDGTEGEGALAPDGRSFVFVSNHGGQPDIWLRQVAGGEAVRLTNDAATESALAYAPNGETIYFTRPEGGNPRDLAHRRARRSGAQGAQRRPGSVSLSGRSPPRLVRCRVEGRVCILLGGQRHRWRRHARPRRERARHRGRLACVLVAGWTVAGVQFRRALCAAQSVRRQPGRQKPAPGHALHEEHRRRADAGLAGG